MVQTGALFSEYYLWEGVRAAADWGDDALAPARERLRVLLADFGERRAPNEAETERDLIEPVLALLGWTAFLPQQTAARHGRSDVPDYLLFASARAKAAAAPLAPADKYGHGAAILEAKAWEVALDRAQGADGAPATQMIRYLGRVEAGGAPIRFGLLTNGRRWRLYDNKARSRLEGYLEIDLMEAAGLLVPVEPREGADEARADHLLRLFLHLFGRAAFETQAGGRTRLDQAVADARGFEARVTAQLADTVFASVFPDLANALAEADLRCRSSRGATVVRRGFPASLSRQFAGNPYLPRFF